MRCPDVKYFKISADTMQEQLGAETISIYGGAR
jgi:hypothetical protein